MIASAKFLSILRDFVPEYHHAKCGCNWSTNKGEKGGAQRAPPPAYIVPKDPSLNRVKSKFYQYFFTKKYSTDLSHFASV